jgi:hypothetical protein
MSLNLLTAILLAVAGFALGLRQILLDPRNATFPCAPFAVRMAMFIGAGALAYMAVKFWGHAGAEPYAGEAAAPVAVLAGLLALYFGAMLVNVLAQRFPAVVWRRIHLYEAKARASQTRAGGGAMAARPAMRGEAADEAPASLMARAHRRA